MVLSCEEILLRVLDRLDEQLPSVYGTLFRPSAQWISRQPLTAQGQPPAQAPPEHLENECPSLRDLYMAGELEWSEGEPAINVYTEAGRFGPHKDHMALTVLIPLTCPTRFSGGGTGFWTRESEELASFGQPEDVCRPAAQTPSMVCPRRAQTGSSRMRLSLSLSLSLCVCVCCVCRDR